jgi:hypothetical protein
VPPPRRCGPARGTGRAALGNQIRSLLAERGIVIAQDITRLPRVCTSASARLRDCKTRRKENVLGRFPPSYLNFDSTPGSTTTSWSQIWRKCPNTTSASAMAVLTSVIASWSAGERVAVRCTSMSKLSRASSRRSRSISACFILQVPFRFEPLFNGLCHNLLFLERLTVR